MKLSYEQRYRPEFSTQGLKNRVLHRDIVFPGAGEVKDLSSWFYNHALMHNGI